MKDNRFTREALYLLSDLNWEPTELDNTILINMICCELFSNIR